MELEIEKLSRKIMYLMDHEMFDESIPYLEQAAALGDIQSQTVLANFYTFGYYVDKDVQQAFHYTLMAAMSGNPDMMVNLAVFYKNGTGTEVNHEEAFYWFSQAARTGSPAGCYGLALCYYYGDGVRQDYTLASAYARQCQQCEGEYQQKAGELLMDLEFEEDIDILFTRSQSVGIDKLEGLAKKNHIRSMILLSAELAKGTYEGHDVQEAFDWALKAANANEPAGMYNTGIYYWYGVGVEENKKEGFFWMKNAAKSGYEDAYLPLAQMYLTGQGVNANVEMALEWSRNALQAHPDDLNAIQTYNTAMEIQDLSRRMAKSKMNSL